MHIPRTPPDRNELFQRIVQSDPQRLPKVLEHPSIVDDKGRYLHWDEMRFKEPPTGKTVEEWWLSTRIARNIAMQWLPLQDASARPFGFCESQIVRAALRYLDMNAGGVLGSDSHGLAPDQARQHLTRSLAEEPFASSFIEGAATTRQIAKKLIFEGREPATKDELMVWNNYQAMQYVKMQSDRPLDMAMILELHRIVVDGTMDNPKDAGRIRENDEIQVVDDAAGEVLHQPPPFSQLNDRLEKLFLFANSEPDGPGWIHPLIKAISLHFMIAYEHPFVDGNGRVARALFYWCSIRAGYWLFEYASISSVIAEARIKYGQAFLLVETDESDLTYFICNQLDTLRKSIDRLHQYVARRKEEVEKLDENLHAGGRDKTFNSRQSYLLNEFVRQRLSRITIQEHQERNKVSYLTARSDLEKLVEAGLLRKSKSGQTSIYRPVANLFDRLAGG